MSRWFGWVFPGLAEIRSAGAAVTQGWVGLEDLPPRWGAHMGQAVGGRPQCPTTWASPWGCVS